MTAQTVSQAVATQEQQAPATPAGMIRQYQGAFHEVMPSHIKPEAWVRIAIGALRRGKKVDSGPERGRYELEVAASNNPGVFFAALLDAARLGLEPGTEQYYLTPRKVKGQLEILGIVGYQGIVELIYRAGAVSSVVAEVVYSADEFDFQPGRDEVPRHRIDWDADDRGEPRLVYAYAAMKDGAHSKVVVLNRHDIERIKKSSQGSSSEYSPWVQHPAAMWLKSAVRQLAKWVPTSAEYVRQAQERAAAQRQEEHAELVAGSVPAALLPPAAEVAVDHSTGEILDSDRVFDGEVVADPDEPSWPETAQPGAGA